ncbi:MAG TPA: K(+)-transporting ATPase subunit C [Acidimicrobiales bacterium]|nr:K(+)-transporting ATPase subunit C [Acidimicrobiales bacterium]
MRRQFLTGLRMTAALLVLLGVLYPLAVTAVAQVAFHDNANGSLVKDARGLVVGSSLLGQRFVDAQGNADPRYFQPRPSASDDDPTVSGATNLGPSNQDLIDAVAQRVKDYRSFNDLADDAMVPVDAVTASGSGLDPHISPLNAELQAQRVADARHMPVDTVRSLISKHTTGRQWGFLGEKVVNVLELNLDLDRTTAG